MGKTARRNSPRRRGYRTQKSRLCHFESLEIRQMLATVNVTSFGATPNDGTDDRAAILKAISASAAGDTILFSGGTFNMSNEITLTGNRTYLGQNGAALNGQGLEGHLLKIQGDGITLRGLALVGGGVFIEKPGGGRNSNIVIDSNTFQMTSTGVHQSALTFTSGLNSSKIINNYFSGTNGGFAMYGYNYMDLTIANNEIVTMAAGMHIDAFGGSGNLLVEQNYIAGTRGMGMEFQGTANNLVFQDNWYEKPSFTTLAGTANGNTMAYSLILDKSNNITIQRNVMIAPKKGSTNDYVRINFEVGGDNTLVRDNFTSGGNHIVAMNDGVGTASVTVRDNRFQDYAQGVSNSFPSVDRTLLAINNTASTTLSDIMEARLAAGQRPGIGSKRYGTSTTSEPTPTTPPTSTDSTIPTTSGTVYLSDIAYKNATNGWGPVEKDQSVGEQASGDGKQIRIGDRTYTKGIGVHSTSKIAYSLGGQYATFSSDIGVDEEVGNSGSVVFEVWADGVLLYSSGVMKGSDGYKAVNVDVSGKQELTLVVTNAGDNTDCDHADWANARLTPVTVSSPAPDPIRTPTSSGGSVTTYLSDLQWLSTTNGWGPAERDTSVGEVLAGDGKVMSIGGKTYSKGLGVHAKSSVKYALNGKYATFSADIGLDDETLGLGSVVFEVWADGQLLYSSGAMTSDDGHRSIAVGVAGRQELTLVVTAADGGINDDHADWADARLTTSGTSLSSVPFTVVQNGYGPVELDRSNGELNAGDGKLITLNGVVYGTGLGVHAPSDIVVNLNGQYARFVSDLGVDDEVFSNGTVVFQVYADGVLVYDSGTMTGSSGTKTVNVDVTGRQQLTLKVLTTADGFGFDHADWAGATVVAAG